MKNGDSDSLDSDGLNFNDTGRIRYLAKQQITERNNGIEKLHIDRKCGEINCFHR